jgi:transcription termination/antitermination protein NusG
MKRYIIIINSNPTVCVTTWVFRCRRLRMFRETPRNPVPIPDNSGDKHWYAVYTKPRHEKVVKRVLDDKQVESFLPLRREISRWADRRIELLLPLFPGYLFVKYSIAKESHKVLATDGLIRVVGNGDMPLPVSETEINSLKILLSHNLDFETCQFLETGQKVKVVGGPLAGVTGIVVKKNKKQRVVISVELIQRSLTVDVDSFDLEPVTKARTAAH